MKHSLKITLILLALFLSAQLIGLVIIKSYLPKETLPYNIQKPEFKEETSFIPLFLVIIIASLLILALIYFRAFRIWKLWFFLSVGFCLLIAFAAFVNEMAALILAIAFASIKTFRPNIIIHNLTELFIYGGLAAVFVPVLNIASISILIVLIAIYDMIAVWKTKHMIKLAKFQSKSRLFAGLLIPYEKNKTAILGGGDIGFPLLFAGTVLKTSGFLDAFIVVLFTSLALLFLLIIAEKKKFYPAIPFLALGCFIGYVISLII